MALTPAIHEHGGKIYIVAPVQVASDPEAEERSNFAFNDDVLAWKVPDQLKSKAPNERLMWLRGQYVEADNANANGDQWTAGELAIKSFTPVFMPVTVMHDFKANVGLIADTRLLTPNKDNVPRARIDTVLAIWAHRFKGIAEEIAANAEQGMLMQSMECVAPYYSCASCGTRYEVQAHQAERELWCDHLNASDGSRAARILGGVTFTGSGLIFGSRGSRGAYSDAHLEVEELAEFHQRPAESRNTPRSKLMPKIEVDQAEFEAGVTAKAELAQVKPQVATLETKLAEATAEVATQTKAVEDAEAAKVKAEGELATEKARADAAEETANQAKLRDERIENLGKGFAARLEKAPTTKANLIKAAGTLDDEGWTARLAELAEAFDVKVDDEGAEPEKTAGLFSEEEVAAASTQDRTTSTASNEAETSSIVGGLYDLFKPPAAKKSA